MFNRILTPTGDATIDGLLFGLKWDNSDPGTPVRLLYSFPRLYSDYDNPQNYQEINTTWYYFNESQQNTFREILASWAAVANITFQESLPALSDITIAFSEAVNADGTASAWTYAIDNGRPLASRSDVFLSDEIAGDIWLRTDLTTMPPGSFAYHTIMHEVGHVLGLKHPFEEERDFPMLPSDLDDTGYTVMSYTTWDGAGYRYVRGNDGVNRLEAIQPTTPMVYDIKAIQYLYGANMNTNTSDTVYTFATEGEFMTIWDAGGIDTIDLSNQQVWAALTLEPGFYSSVGFQPFDANGLTGEESLFNIAVAADTWIENIIGSRYNDTFQGNQLDNRITGGMGNDEIDGGAGTDTAVYSANMSQYRIYTQDDRLVVSGPDGTDILVNVEQLSFQDQQVTTAQALNIPTQTPAPTQAPERALDVNFRPAESDKAWFFLELDYPISTDAQVNYTTRDGTAIAGSDYVAQSGVATIHAGGTHIVIGIDLIDDQISEQDETFSLVVTNPVGGIFSDNTIELVATRTIIDNDIG